MALDLIRGFSSSSYVGRKLWAKVVHLKDIGPKLGILSCDRRAEGQYNAPCSTDAGQFPTSSEPDAGFTTHFGTSQQLNSSAPELMPLDDLFDPVELTDELKNLFGAIRPVRKSPLAGNAGLETLDCGFGPTYGSTEDFSRSFLDL